MESVAWSGGADRVERAPAGAPPLRTDVLRDGGARAVVSARWITDSASRTPSTPSMITTAVT